MHVLALDMTLCHTGYVVGKYAGGVWTVVGAGLTESLKEPESTDSAMRQELKRGAELLQRLQQLNEQFHPRHLIVEQLEGTKSAHAARTFGIAIGVLTAFLEQNKLQATLYRAIAVKKRMTGKKSASKQEMIRAAIRRQPDLFLMAGFEKHKSGRSKGEWPDKVEHVADAFGLFITATEGPDLRHLTQLVAELKAEQPEDGSSTPLATHNPAVPAAATMEEDGFY